MIELPHYSQGVCEDGAAILCNGERMTVDEIVAKLNEGTMNDMLEHAAANMADHTMVALWVERGSAWVETHVCFHKSVDSVESSLVLNIEDNTIADVFSEGVNGMCNPQQGIHY